MSTFRLDNMSNFIGQEMGVSDWLQIDQTRINQFAACTGDHQWIHVDVERAKSSPFGATIAHGFLTLSLLIKLNEQIQMTPEGVQHALNYGCNKVRFLNPVKVNQKIRNRVVLQDVVDKGNGRYLITFHNTVEIEGESKSAMVAETLVMLFAG